MRRLRVGIAAGTGVVVGALFSPAGGEAQPGASAAPAARPQTPPSPTFSQTWSAGPLNDRNQPIAQSSPVVATLDNGGPAVVVGDRTGFIYALHLSDGTSVANWPVNDAHIPIDSSPSVLSTPGAPDVIFVGAGNAAQPGQGAYEAYSASGSPLWYSYVTDPPSDDHPAHAVQASPTVAALQGRQSVVAGSLDQEQYALDATTGSTLPGWPFFTSDSVFSTAAVADLYGTGSQDIVEGGDQSAGFALGRNYQQGGHLRILNASGGLICDAHTNQTVYSSPAVGPFLPGGTTGIAVGTGAFFAGASDTDALKVFDTRCNAVWSRTLDGNTSSSPALANVTGNGTLSVVEGTDTGSGGSVWALDGPTGATIWHQPVVGRVIGSVVTANLSGGTGQDVLVPTTAGVEVLDGASGAELTVLSPDLGFQNSPLVTHDPDGAIGVTVAGYDGTNQGEVRHYEISGSNGSAASDPSAWPMFHHDPGRTGVIGTGPVPAPCSAPPAAFSGYTLVASDGGVFAFGSPFCGSTGGIVLNAPVVGMAKAANVGGYWLVASDGGVFSYGQAPFYGSTGVIRLDRPVVAMAATPDGRGYWLVGSDGGVFSFGDAGFFGSAAPFHPSAPVVGIVSTADGQGYWLVGADGGVFAFGDAQFFGSVAGQHLRAPVVGMVFDAATGGYWLAGADGGVFSFGAPFYGSLGAYVLAGPVVSVVATRDGQGYWLVGADGGVFAFGDAPFRGSMGGQRLTRPVVGLAP